MSKRNWLLACLLVLGLVATWGVAGARADRGAQPLGNHSLRGAYEFHADGVIEVDNTPTRGFWEAGRFDADGKGNMTGGTEYSNMLTEDEAAIDTPLTFTGTYNVAENGVATADVVVVIPGGFEIHKRLWFVLHSVGRDGIANGFAGGHTHADLGGGTHANARVHEGWRMHRTAP